MAQGAVKGILWHKAATISRSVYRPDEPRRRDGVGVRRLSIVALDFLRRTRFGDPRVLIDRFSVSLLTFDRGSY
jgi:hypothetical protein